MNDPREASLKLRLAWLAAASALTPACGGHAVSSKTFGTPESLDAAFWTAEVTQGGPVTATVYGLRLGEPHAIRLGTSEDGIQGWAPDRTRMMLRPNGDCRLVAVDAARTVRRTRCEFSAIEWSPDSSRTALWSYDGTLSIGDADGNNAVIPFDDELSPWAGAAWSPDGSKLALESDGAVIVTDANLSETISFSGLRVSWAPDGRRLALGGRSGFELVNVDGSDSVNVQYTGAVAAPEFELVKWSGDGTWVSFHDPLEVEDEGGIALERTLTVVRADGSDRTAIGARKNEHWSPVGAELAFSDDAPRAETGESVLTLWTPDGSWSIPLAAFGANPVWSPDGTRLLVSDLSGSMIVPSDGADPILIDADYGASWSPDGSRVLLRSAAGLATTTAEGHEIATIAPDFSDAGWLPDSDHVGVATKHDVSLVRADGSETTRYWSQTGDGIVIWER